MNSDPAKTKIGAVADCSLPRENVKSPEHMRNVEDFKPSQANPLRAETLVFRHARSESKLPDLLLSLAFLGDALAVMAGLFLGFWIRFRSDWIPIGVEAARGIFLKDYLGLIGIGALFLLVTFSHLRLYDTRNLLRYRRVVLIIVNGTLFWLCAYLGVSLALKFTPPISRIYVAVSFVASLLTLLGWRYLFHRILHLESIACELRQRILFVGWNPEAETLVEAVGKDLSQPYEIVGCVPSPLHRFTAVPPPNVPQMGEYSDLPSLLEKGSVDVVVLADLDPDVGQIVALSNLCEQQFVQFKVIPSYFQILASCLALDTISGVPILGNSELPLERPFNRFLKRSVDIVGSLVGLFISWPVVAYCAFRVYRESPGPVLYRQERMGRNGTTFKIIKIRSMSPDAESNGAQWAKKDDPRRLRIGAFMREWNIDEIPQFWNVLKGEMSLVGPRPERPELIKNFKHQIPHYNARHGTKPGMTGWAQINGLRGDTSLVERVRYDLFYLENWSLLLDFQIMLLTFFKRDNAY